MQDCRLKLPFRGNNSRSPCVAKSALDILQDIESKSNNFFTAIKDVVLPLLGDKERFYQNKKTSFASVRPYESLDPQPIG